MSNRELFVQSTGWGYIRRAHSDQIYGGGMLLESRLVIMSIDDLKVTRFLNWYMGYMQLEDQKSLRNLCLYIGYMLSIYPLLADRRKSWLKHLYAYFYICYIDHIFVVIYIWERIHQYV